MVSEGAVVPVSCAAAESVRLKSVRLVSAVRSLCISPFPLVDVAMAGGSRRFYFVETRLAASRRVNGDEGQTCVGSWKHRELRGTEVIRGNIAELRSAWTGGGARPLHDQSQKDGQECPPYTLESDIQVFHVQRVVFDELSAGFYVFAHQGGEDGFALGYVFE